VVVPNVSVEINDLSITNTPSIGEVGIPYFDEKNNRVKFLDTNTHTSVISVNRALDDCINMMNENEASRVNARFFINKGSVDYVVSGLSNGVTREASIPLSGSFEGLEWLILGKNVPTRISPKDVLEDERRMAIDIFSNSRKPIGDVTNDYDVRMLTSQDINETIVNSMVNLYKEAFKTYLVDLDEDAVIDMIEGGNVCAAIYKNTGEVVATSVAEIAGVNTGLGVLRLCELSEMATRREHRGKNLMKYATNLLIENVKDKTDLVYAEARASHGAINSVFNDLGFKYAGRLNKQCILSGDSDVKEYGKYENLNVVFLPN